jgi:predicted transcriptional regulator
MTEKKKDPMEAELDFLGQAIREPTKYPERFVAIPRSSTLLGKIFSAEPNRILDYLEKHGHVQSVQRLANALHRDKAAVSRDVKLLEHVGLVIAKRVGKEKILEPSHKMVVVR